MKPFNASFKCAFEDSLPIAAGYIVMGMAFGLLMARAGYSWWFCGLMGLIIYSGTMQFVAVTLLVSGASLAQAALLTFLVNARYIFYSISMVERYKDRGLRRPYLFFALTDETYALVSMPHDPGVAPEQYDWYLSLLDHSYWILGDVLGALLGAALTFNTAGVDFAMTALFIVILCAQLEEKKNRLPAAIGLLSTLCCLLVFGAEHFLIPSMLCILAGLLYYRKYRNNNA